MDKAAQLQTVLGRLAPQQACQLAHAVELEHALGHEKMPSGPILEARRPNGQFSRFDRRRGYFGAYNPDRTIRTFFIPNDGERYFRRQAQRYD